MSSSNADTMTIAAEVNKQNAAATEKPLRKKATKPKKVARKSQKTAKGSKANAVGKMNQPASAKTTKAPKDTKPEAEGAREGSKTAAILELLRHPKGATLAEIVEATSWQAHSVRGFISGTLGKKRGLIVKSEKGEDGVRVYSIAK